MADGSQPVPFAVAMTFGNCHSQGYLFVPFEQTTGNDTGLRHCVTLLQECTRLCFVLYFLCCFECRHNVRYLICSVDCYTSGHSSTRSYFLFCPIRHFMAYPSYISFLWYFSFKVHHQKLFFHYSEGSLKGCSAPI